MSMEGVMTMLVEDTIIGHKVYWGSNGTYSSIIINKAKCLDKYLNKNLLNLRNLKQSIFKKLFFLLFYPRLKINLLILLFI